MGTLKPQSNGPLYSNTGVIGRLAVDGWAVTFGTRYSDHVLALFKFCYYDTFISGNTAHIKQTKTHNSQYTAKSRVHADRQTNRQTDRHILEEAAQQGVSHTPLRGGGLIPP